MLLGAVSSAAAAVDEFFNRVTLLLPGNGTNGAQNNTFLDSSTNNFTITRNGNTTQGTFSPFSQTGWSNFFGGTGNYATSTSSAIATSTTTFTIEGWIYATATPVTTSNIPSVIADCTPASTQLFWGFGPLANGTLSFYWFDGAAKSVTGNTTIALNTWAHIAISVNANAITLYVNGTQQTLTGTTTLTNRSGSTATPITFAQFSTGGSYFTGYISNFSVLSGTAKYSASFTPSTTPLATGTTNQVLLFAAGNRFADFNTATTAKTFTITGTPSVQAFEPFAPGVAYSAATVGGSGYFDGSGDYLTYTTPSTVVREWWVNDFTVEAWIYPTTLTGWDYLDGGNRISTVIGNASPTATNNFWSFGPINTGAVKLYYFNGSAGISVTSTETVKVNQWNHIAFTKTSGGATLFVNGVGTTTTALNGTPQSGNTFPLTVGQINNTSCNGYISGVRILNGTAQYSGTTYTIPTAPPTAIANTSFLLNFTNAGITDATAKNDLETVGNAQISTTQSKFGGSSMYFDGTGDWLVARYNPNLELGSGDFTVEAWVYFSTLPSNAAAAIVAYGDSDNTPRWLLYYDSRSGTANGLRFTVIDGSGSAIILVEGGGTSGWAANTWYHVAVTRSGNSWRLFRDGTQTGSTLTDTDAIPAASNNGLVVGAEPNGGIPLTGYIDDLRITKGYARYTANFTAPTSAFALQ